MELNYVVQYVILEQFRKYVYTSDFYYGFILVLSRVTCTAVYIETINY